MARDEFLTYLTNQWEWLGEEIEEKVEEFGEEDPEGGDEEESEDSDEKESDEDLAEEV